MGLTMAVSWCPVFFFVCWLGGTLGFNLEPRIPVIKNGAAESFFGFSVALHQSFEERYDGREIRKDWVLVGAPLGKNLQPQTEKSGALWKCPVSTRQDDCIQVETDGRSDPVRGRYIDRSEDLLAPADTELKEGQWMGVTVRSQGAGRKVLVCAHRYIKRGPDNDWHWGQGLCYTLKQNFEHEHDWIPCQNLDVTRQHEQFGYCQAGTSGLLTDDDTALLGLPGPYTWRGTVFAVNVSNSFLHRDKTQYFGPVTASTSPVDKYSYLGMALAYGKFFPDLETKSIVAGAPRSKGTGQVVFFSRERIGQKTLRYDLILDGERHFSQFGYELCSADFDNNGMTDLVVGAPFHFTDEGEKTGGAIYIYLTPTGGLTKNTKPTRILGAPESRFGFALAALGDLNKDGYPDLAVGAPFEESGVVRIYLGGSKGVNTEPAQVIRSEDVVGARTPITFGYSLSGGMDVDGNGYPDLLIGSFCNDTVALIRARPIVGIETKVERLAALSKINPSDLKCDKLPRAGVKCVTFDACFKMESLDGLKTSVDLEYILEAETFQPGRRFSRVRFLDGQEDRQNVVNRTLPLSANSTKQYFCQEETMIIKKGTRDIQSEIPMKLTYSLKQRVPRQGYPGGSLPQIDNFPILNQQEASKIIYAKFVKNCGSDDICQSMLRVKPVFDLRTDEEGSSVLEKETGKLLRINTTIINDGESAYNARLMVSYPPSISFVGKEPTDHIACENVGNQLICNLGNPVEKGRQDMVLRFNVDQLDDDAEFVEFGFGVNTTSEQQESQVDRLIRARVAKRSEIILSGVALPEQVFYGGEVKGENEVKNLDEVGSPVLHKYEVYNDGPSTVETVDVLIDWPVEVQSPGPRGKWLLYLTKPPVVEGDGECFFDKALINPRNLELLQEEPVFSASVTGAFVGITNTNTQTSTGGSSGGTTSGTTSGTTGGTTGYSYKNSTSISTSITSSSSSDTEGSRVSGSVTGDHHDRVAVEDVTIRKTDYGRGQNTLDDRPEHAVYHGATGGRATTAGSFDSQAGGGQYQGARGGGGEYEGGYQGATGVRARRPGRRGFYRRRLAGGSTGGNQSYTYHRQYESRQPLSGHGRGAVDLAGQRDELSSRRVGGGVERVERLDDGTRRTYEAHRDLEDGQGFERELTTEEDRRTRRDVGVRRRREREMVVMPEAVTASSGEVKQVVFFDCARKTAKCVQLRCRINNLKRKQYALVHLQGRIWNHTLVEDYGKVSYVSIKSTAKLEMDPTLEQLQDVSDDVASAETIAYPDLPVKADEGGAPIWVIIVSVLAGLLLLAIICLILWKLGFFKRRRPDPTLKSNLRK